MVAPVVWAALAGGGAALLGGAMGGDREREENQRSIQAAERQGTVNYERQKEFAKMGLQWKAADAQAAGLHPLAALGGMGSSYSPSNAVGQTTTSNHEGRALSEAGQHVSRAIAATESAEDQKLRDAQLQAIQASTAKDLAQAQYWGSEATRGRQAAGPGIPDGVVPRSRVEVAPLTYDHIKPKADEQTSVRSEDRSVTAGTHAAWEERVLRTRPGQKPLTLITPQGSEWAENLGEMPWLFRAEVVRRSAAASGMSSLEWISQVGLGEDFTKSAKGFSIRGFGERPLNRSNSSPQSQGRW